MGHLSFSIRRQGTAHGLDRHPTRSIQFTGKSWQNKGVAVEIAAQEIARLNVFK
jgi:hypothetical protein